MVCSSCCESLESGCCGIDEKRSRRCRRGLFILWLLVGAATVYAFLRACPEEDNDEGIASALSAPPSSEENEPSFNSTSSESSSEALETTVPLWWCSDFRVGAATQMILTAAFVFVSIILCITSTCQSVRWISKARHGQAGYVDINNDGAGRR